MSASPLISCIMPTKNRREFVRRSLAMYGETQLRLWLKDGFRVELIVLEDGESHCDDLCAKWREANPVVSIRYHRYEGTLGEKLNEGARLARGKYVINWDDDDFQHPERLANVIKHFELTGASMVAMSSMPYWREGEETVWIYNAGDARYGTGSGQAFLRDWVLANPHPDITVGEDEVMCRKAAEQGVLSTISGTDWVVACTHDAHCTNRQSPFEGELERIFGRPADNWQRSHISKFSWVQRWAFDSVSA